MSSPREGDTDLIVLNDKLYAFIFTRKTPTKKLRTLFPIKLLILPTGAYFQAPSMALNHTTLNFFRARQRSCSHELLPSRLADSSRRLAVSASRPNVCFNNSIKILLVYWKFEADY